MEHLYSNLDSPGAADLATSFMEDLETFLAGCNSTLVMRTISTLQDGLAFWIKDDESRLSSRQAAETASAVRTTHPKVECKQKLMKSTGEAGMGSDMPNHFCAGVTVGDQP